MDPEVGGGDREARGLEGPQVAASSRRRRLLWTAAFVFACLMTLAARPIDEGVLRWFEDARRPAITRMALVVTSAWTIIALVALGSFYLALRGRKREAAVTVAATLFTLGLGSVIKEAVERPRPYVTLSEFSALVTAEDASFPSNHTNGSFTLAIVLGLFVRPLRLPLYFLAAGIATTRLYIGVHYPSDICGGLALAVFSAAWFIEVFARPEKLPSDRNDRRAATAAAGLAGPRPEA